MREKNEKGDDDDDDEEEEEERINELNYNNTKPSHLKSASATDLQ